MTPEQLAAAAAILDRAYPPAGPGAALVVAVDGQPVFVRCRGLARAEEGVAITPETVFDLASMGKHITAFAVLQLASRGALFPLAPVRDYLPELAALDLPGRRPLCVADLA